MGAVEIHGYAIVSDDDRIAGADGATPEALRNEADWAYFQSELDRASLTVLGRLGHEANPNRRNRARLVLSSRAQGVQRVAGTWWWNPADIAWDEASKTVLPDGGRVAVPGGQRVFDLFLDIGYDAFHLSRAEGVSVPGGVALFSACDRSRHAEEVLAAYGLEPAERRLLDPTVPVRLVVWRRAPSQDVAATQNHAGR
jgi:hypothetical protein